MEPMTVYELTQLIRMNEEAISTQFQVWLTITFSTIVAVFAGRELLNSKTKLLVTALFLLASMATFSASLYLAESNAQLSILIKQLGSAYSPPIFAGTVYFFVFLAGISTTVYFINMEVEVLFERDETAKNA